MNPSNAGTMQSSTPNEPWMQKSLTIVVIGASGDLAKKKTYPALFQLYQQQLLPPDVQIWGYARSKKTHQQLRDQLLPYLPKDAALDFLQLCFYQSGRSYSDEDAYRTMMQQVQQQRQAQPQSQAHCNDNRIFYFAIPPNVFGETAVAIRRTAMHTAGWTRVVIEKPFGRDWRSCHELLGTLSQQLREDQMYRIDHYLGKEVVQNMMTWRFGNTWTQPIWHRRAVDCVFITFREPFGTEGRGGYFDNYGILRDVLQNHLLQILTVVAMERPRDASGAAIRDAKVEVLKHISTLKLGDDVLLGQYDGYAKDPTIQNKDTNCPTFAAVRCRIDTPRWHGVPFILQAGKALQERLCEVRIRLKPAPSLPGLAHRLPHNEIVMRLQPDRKLELVHNIKTPGLSTAPMQASLQLSYASLLSKSQMNPDAYTRLLLHVLRGNQAPFVRDDELLLSWKIFTPLLHQIEAGSVRPHSYEYGSNGPSPHLERWLERMLGRSSGDGVQGLAGTSSHTINRGAQHKIRSSL